MTPHAFVSQAVKSPSLGHISVFRVPRGIFRETFNPLISLHRLAWSMGAWESSTTDIQTSTHFLSKEKNGNQTYGLSKPNKVNFFTTCGVSTTQESCRQRYLELRHFFELLPKSWEHEQNCSVATMDALSSLVAQCIHEGITKDVSRSHWFGFFKNHASYTRF